MDLAEQIDNIQGNDVWRTEKTCALYESERIQARIDELVSVLRCVMWNVWDDDFVIEWRLTFVLTNHSFLYIFC